jgi:8-oxo-dGTP pyrophosphatase MutT (NUDIX family)
MKQLVKLHPNIMSQNCEAGHITGSALVCDNQGRCLLHHHKKLNRWLQVGGHAEYETDFADVALREAQEETGLPDLKHFPNADNPFPIDFDIHTISATDTGPEHVHLDFRYMLMTNRSEQINIPEGESKKFVWATFDEILNPTDPDDKKLLDPALKRLISKCKNRYSVYSHENRYQRK